MKHFPQIALYAVYSITTLQGADPLPLSPSYWKDPRFLHSFNGSYRINARIEPYVTSEQRAVLLSVQSAMRKGERNKALRILTQSRLTPKSAALLYNQANIAFELGKTKEALASYQAAIKLYPSFRRAHKNMGTVLLRENRFSEAQKSLSQSIELGDLNGHTLGLLGYCYLHSNNYLSALQAYNMAQLTQPDTLEWQAGMAQCLLELNRTKEAINLLERVTETQPQQASYQLLLVDALLRNSNNTAALARLELLRRQKKLNITHLSLLAQLYLREELAHLADPILVEIQQQLSLQTITSYLDCISSLNQLGEHQKAITLIKAASHLKLPKDEQTSLSRLQAIAQHQLGSPTASNTLKNVLKTNPLDGEVLLLLAADAQKQKAFSTAHFYYERATRLPDFKYTALLEQGKLFVQQQNYSLALEKLNSAAKLNPSKELTQYLRSVQAIEDTGKP